MDSSHLALHFPLFWLVIVTLGVVLVAAVWNYISTHRQKKYGSQVKGMGGKNDPLS
jgi:hypothetical protein